jgi:hypothetical protein
MRWVCLCFAILTYKHIFCNVLTSSCDNPSTSVREGLDLTKQVDVAVTCI